MALNEFFRRETAEAASPMLSLKWWLRPRMLVVTGLATVLAGFVWNWEWLTAIGIAPILLSFAPCAAMCALGLCMRKGASSSCQACAPADTTETLSKATSQPSSKG